MKLFRKLRDCRKNQSGSTAVEFALLALPFFALVAATIQLGIIFLSNQTLDAAIDTVSRRIQTGQVAASGFSESQFRDLICSEAILVGDCNSNIEISVRSFPNITALEEVDLYDSKGFPIIEPVFDPGAGGDIVVVSARITIPVLGGEWFFGDAFGANGMQLLTSKAFTNEEFS